MPSISMGVRGAGRARRMSTGLRRAARMLPAEMDRALDREGQRTRTAVRVRIAGLPAVTGQHSGLRAALAAAVTLSPTANGIGFRLSVPDSAMPADKQGLPVAVDRGVWTHPVHGGPARVTQTMPPGYFTATVQGREGDMRGALEQALDTVAASIA